jgi:hypothetical protein
VEQRHQPFVRWVQTLLEVAPVKLVPSYATGRALPTGAPLLTYHASVLLLKASGAITHVS